MYDKYDKYGNSLEEILNNYKYKDYTYTKEDKYENILDNTSIEEFIKQWKTFQSKEDKWLEQLEEMDITIVEQFVRKKKLERIKKATE